MAGRCRCVDRGLHRRHRQGCGVIRLSGAAGQGCLRQRHHGNAPDRYPQPCQPALWRRRHHYRRRVPTDGRRDGLCMAGRGFGAFALHLRKRRPALRRTLTLCRAWWYEEPRVVHSFLRARKTLPRAGEAFTRIAAAIATLGKGEWL
ncbi:hypothetical protein MES5069_200031 [Mesorhizobium escarrei]|uniref:LysR substrate-binding domain-containing protein n=1 Tax=Mesorhizobium escarrei TaxID=666018 RepID=A0ABM9DPA0_9HYPH|nr:hypothetical protein MES5069_200031 [Mesorhizobium escarrei]